MTTTRLIRNFSIIVYIDRGKSTPGGPVSAETAAYLRSRLSRKRKSSMTWISNVSKASSFRCIR